MNLSASHRSRVDTDFTNLEFSPAKKKRAVFSPPNPIHCSKLGVNPWGEVVITWGR